MAAHVTKAEGGRDPHAQTVLDAAEGGACATVYRREGAAKAEAGLISGDLWGVRVPVAGRWVNALVVDAAGKVGLAAEATGPVGALAVPTAAASAGVSVAVTGSGPVLRAVFTFAAVAVVLQDAGAAGAHGKIKIGTFAPGFLHGLGATCDLALVAGAGVDAAGTLVCGVGTAGAASDNATLAGIEQNVLPSTAVVLTASAGAFKGKPTATEAAVLIDGTATAADLWLNVVAADATVTGAGPFAVTVSGTLTLAWINLGAN